MKRASTIFKIVAILSLIGIILSIGLIEYHYSFDPYSWLDPSREDVFSRNLWNERKSQYIYLGIFGFASLLSSLLFLGFGAIVGNRNRLK